MISSGERIQALRKEKNLTQDELAKKLECSKQSIYRYENNQSQMDTHTLIKTADFFEVSIDYLLGKSNQRRILEDIYSDHSATFYDEDYFWIIDGGKSFGAHTRWDGFTAEGKEKRVPRPIIPEKAFDLCKKLYGPPLVINSDKDVRTFIKIGGNALIRETLCKKFFPKFMEPYVVDSYKPY